MEKERTTGIRILGWFFIILSFIFLFVFPKIIYSYYNYLDEAASRSPENNNFLPTLIISTLIGFFSLFVTGIGILKFKRWAYYLVFLVIYVYFASIIKGVLIFGPQYADKYSTFALLFISIAIIVFLMNRNIIEQFKADFITKKGKRMYPKKFLLLLSLMFIALTVISITGATLMVKIKLKNDTSANLKPQKIGYHITDRTYILNNCEKRDIFDYSVYIPKDFKIGSISIGDSKFGWTLALVKGDGSKLQSFIILESKGSEYLLPLGKVFGFKTAYDFEKRINYPSWSPILLVLKTVGSQNLVGIDDATASTWRGFIRIGNSKDKEKKFYDASLYSLQSNKACKALVLFENKLMTSEQAKSIIASLEFKDIEKNSELLSERGKNDLSNMDFVSASINFMNALYFDKKNSEYAYYLARSLFEDNSQGGRKGRLYSSKRFLEYALKLNPNHQEAKELLVYVDNEIKKLEQIKKD